MKSQQELPGNGGAQTTEAHSSAMTAHSTAFQNGAPIPQRFSCQGENISPELSWSGAPAGTKSFALLCEDPDAPGGTFYHWVLYNIPSDDHELAEHIMPIDPLPNGARQGINSFQQLGYGGPCPPAGNAHHYHFRLFALDTAINIPGVATHDQLENAIRGHILAEGELIGTYQRK